MNMERDQISIELIYIISGFAIRNTNNSFFMFYNANLENIV